MKPYHIGLLALYFIFLLGLITGIALAHNPVLWVLVVILSAIAIGAMGWASTISIKPRKKSIPRRASRIVR